MHKSHTHTAPHILRVDPKYITETHTQSKQPHTYTQTHCRYTDHKYSHALHTESEILHGILFLLVCYTLTYVQFPPYVSSHLYLTFCYWPLLSIHSIPNSSFSSTLQSNHQHQTVVTNEKGHYTISKYSKLINIEYQTPLILKPLCNFCTSEYLTDPCALQPPDLLLCFSCSLPSEDHPHSSTLFSWSQDLCWFPLLHSPLLVLRFHILFPKCITRLFS